MKRSIVKRRLLILAASVLALTLAAGAFVGYRWHRNRVQMTAWREEGLKAYKAGDDSTAVDKLTLYLGRRPDDVEALAAYVDVRPRVELPKYAHLAATLKALRYLVQLQPDRLDERRKLLALYRQVGQETETLETADALLQRDPKDIVALEGRALALVALKRYEEALIACNGWVAADPLNLNALVARLSVHSILNHPTAAITAEIDQWAAAHPGQEAREELLKAIALSGSGDRGPALAMLRSATKRTPPDDTFSQMLVAQFAFIGDPNEDIGVLKDLVARGAGARLRESLMCRQWEVGDVKSAAQTALTVDLRDSSTPLQTTAIASICARDTGDAAAAAARLGHITSRGDPAALAWASLLGPAPKDAASLQALVSKCRDALAADPRQLYMRYFLGEALASLQEYDLAVEAWQQVAERNLTWSQPLARMAEVLLQQGSLERAAAAASAGFRRAQNVSSAMVMARVIVALNEAGRGPASDAVLKLLDDVQKVLPNNEQANLLRVQALAHAGRHDQANALIDSMLRSTPAPSEAALLRLAQIAAVEKLGNSDRILQQDQTLYGSTPSLAFKEATDKLQAGDAAGGLTVLQTTRQSAKAADLPRWDLILTRYLDLAGDASAPSAWQSLGEKYPADSEVQQAILTARATQGSRPILESALARLKTILGDQSLVCSLARVRILVQTRSGDADDREIAETLKQITVAHPTMAEPRVIWSQNLERQGKLDEAIDQLQLAVQANPDLLDLPLRLARLYREKGMFQQSRQMLDRVIASKNASLTELKIAASMLAEAGQNAQAQAVLERIDAQTSTQDDLGLAELYWRRNQIDKAQAIITASLAHPTPAALKLAARFYASLRKADDSRRALEALGRMKLAPGELELAQADTLAASGNAEAAIAKYQSAHAAAPANPAVTRALIAFLIITGRNKEAAATIDAASGTAAGGDAWLTAVKQMLPELSGASADPHLQPIAMEFLRDPENAPADADILRSVARASAPNASPDAVTAARLLSQKYADVEGVQLWAAGVYQQARRFSDAGAVLNRAVTAFPGSAESASEATAYHAAHAQWSEMLDSARLWSQRSSDARQADMAVARALMFMGRAGDGATALARYFPGARADAGQDSALIAAYAECLAVSGASSAAVDFLTPLASDARFRDTCLRVAAQRLAEADAVAWLTRDTGAVDEKSIEQVAPLAAAWAILSDRFPKNAQYLAQGKRLYALIEDRADAPAATLEAAAVFAERHGDAPRAMALFRRVLALDSHRPLALNEMAVMLTAMPGGLAEAAKDAELAVQYVPQEPEFLDTLSMVQTKAGDYRSAARIYQRAIEMDPENVRWRIALAQSQLDGGQPDQAGKTVAAIDAMGADASRLPQALRDQLQGIRARLAPPAASPSASLTPGPTAVPVAAGK